MSARDGDAPDLDAVSDAVDTPHAPSPEIPAVAAEPLVRPAAPSLERPSADVAVVPAASRIPGAAKEGYHQLPTAPVITPVSAPDDADAGEWEPDTAAVATARRARVSPWALGVAVVALAASVVVGWMLPLALVAVVTAVVALRRGEPRVVPVWALALGVLATLYSAGWLLWAFPQLAG